MKKLLVIAASGLVCLSSCYKEKKPSQGYDVLIRHKWKIAAHVATSADTGVDCSVPTEVVFNKDSTGYFYYYTPCFVGDNPMKSFRWKVSADNLNIYFTDLEGVIGTSHICGLSGYDNNEMRLRSAPYNGHYWDGYFVAYANK